MKQRTAGFSFARGTATILAAGMLLLVAQAQAQVAAEFKIRQVSADFADSPIITYSTSKPTPVRPMAAGQSRWLRIETQYDSGPEWADDVRLDYYVLMGDAQQAMLLTGSETYMSVPRGANHTAVMFIHPRTVARFMKSGQAVKQLTVLLQYQNRLADAKSLPANNTRWWEQMTPTPGFLLSRIHTPWAVLDNDRYEVIKPTP